MWNCRREYKQETDKHRHVQEMKNYMEFQNE